MTSSRRTSRPTSGPAAAGDRNTIARIPGWVTPSRAQTVEDVAFLSGAEFGTLHRAVARADVPQALWRYRLTLGAATACVAVAGRPEQARELRDAVHLLSPGDHPGHVGEVCLHWQRTVERLVSAKALHRALPGVAPGTIAEVLGAGQGSSVARAPRRRR